MSSVGLRQLLKLPSKSDAYEDGPLIEIDSAEASIWFDYETEAGTYDWSALRFLGMRAFQHLDAFACGAEEHRSYHVLHEVLDSRWAKDVMAKSETRASRRLPSLHHYRFYLDDIGVYEIIAERWVYLPKVAPPPRAVLLKRTREESEENRYAPCPCCDTRTISKPDTFEVCSRCGWEDDPAQLANPALVGGANELSLSAARAACQANPKSLIRN